MNSQFVTSNVRDFSNSNRVQKPHNGKYFKYDDVLGCSKHLSSCRRKTRYINYEKGQLHSKQELKNFLKERGLEGNLVFDVTATIPYSILGFNDDPSEQEFDTLTVEIISMIKLTTGLNFIFKQKNLNNKKQVSYKQFICKQDVMSKRSGTKTSYLKEFDCKSNLVCKYQPGFGYVTIELKHEVHHATIETLSCPPGLSEFIEQSNCFRLSELCNMISKDPRFVKFYNQNSSKSKNIIKTLWIKLVVSKHNNDDFLNLTEDDQEEELVSDNEGVDRQQFNIENRVNKEGTLPEQIYSIEDERRKRKIESQKLLIKKTIFELEYVSNLSDSNFDTFWESSGEDCTSLLEEILLRFKQPREVAILHNEGLINQVTANRKN